MRLQIKYYIISLLLALSFSVPVISQSHYFRHYQVEQGLSHNTVFSCVQDKRGFIWMGTKDGLDRFDGYSFKVFRNDPEDSLSIGDNFIRSLYIDKDDHLYVGTRNGLYKYSSHRENFSLLFKTNEEVRDIKKDSLGNCWFIAGQQLYSVNEAAKKTRAYPVPDYFAATSICIDGAGEVWVSTATGLIEKYNANNNNFVPFNLFSSTGVTSSKWIEKIFATNHHTILVGTSNYGVKEFSLADHTYKDLLTYAPNGTAIFARDFIQSSGTELWIATESGIFILNTVTGKFTNLHKQYDNPYSVSDNAVYTLTRDIEGGIWAGTYFGGVNYYPKQYVSFEKIFPGYNTYSLSGNAVREICEDKFGNLWVGTEDAGLNKLDKVTGLFKRYIPSGSVSDISYPNIHGLLARGDELWIGTFEHGLDVMNIKTGKVVRHYPGNKTPGVLKSNFIVVIAQTRQGTIYIGTRQGMYRFNEATNAFDSIAAVPSYCFIHSIMEDKDGTLWIGTMGNGLFRYNPAKNTSGNFTYQAANKKSLNSNSITTIFQASNADLWIGTEGGGLCKFNPADSSFTNYSAREGFPSNTIFKIVEDKNHLLWISTAKGLVSFDPPADKITIYTTANGLLSNQFNYNSGYKDSSGKIYFGSAKGLISFKPDSFTKNTYTPPVYITGLYVNNKEITVGSEDSPLEKAISYTNSVKLPYDQSSFSIDFAALSFTAPEMMEYMYIMEGLDKDWTYLKTNRKVYFTNLSPGTYTFSVKAANSSGTWSENVAKLEIRLMPPFWASPLAYGIYILFAAVIIYLLVKNYHDRHNEKTRRRIELLEHEKEKEIYQAKIEFFTNVAHEIKTPLTLIKAPMEKIIKRQNENLDIEHNLRIMERNTDRLIELTNQLLDFRKIETTGFQLNFVMTSINELLLERYTSFKPLAEQKNIALSIDLPDQTVLAEIDIDALQKILNNLFYNALTYCKRKVDIRLLQVNEPDTYVTITISNDGYLIPQELKEKIFKPLYRLKETQNKSGSGIGLALSKSLVDLHKGEIYLNEPGNNMNTFILKLPLHQEGGTDFTGK